MEQDKKQQILDARAGVYDKFRENQNSLFRWAVDEKQWKSEIGFIKTTHERLTDAVISFDPDMLDQPAGKHTTRNAIEFIRGVAEHRLYHTAQMEMIKTLAKHKGVKQSR